MSIGFVIVTYESERVLPLCLKSLPKGHDVIVVDNASKDRSAEIARSFGGRVIVNKKNLGFGSACNQGAKLLSTSHVFFLNPDAILDGSTVSELEKEIARHPDAGGWGPAIRVAAKRQKFRSTSFPQNKGARYTEESPPVETSEVDFLDGAALVVGLDVFREIGGFDENIFLYYEDDDLCFRIRSKNKKLIYAPAANLFHKRNASSGTGVYLEYFRSFHATKSRVYMCKKYGISYDVRKERKRASILLFRALLSLNLKKGATATGTLFALHSGEQK